MPNGETITELFPSRDSSRSYYLDHSTGSQQLQPGIQNDLSRNLCFFLTNRVYTSKGQDLTVLPSLPHASTGLSTE